MSTVLPRPTPSDALLHRLEWRVVRRLDGRLQGSTRTARRGSGFDLAGLRSYVEGDDARLIDWNATARLDEAQVRQFNEDRELTSWLVLDRSASMGVGPPGRTKAEVLVELTLVLARLLGRNGNRVGAVLHGAGDHRIVPPGSGRRQALRIARELTREREPEASRPTGRTARADRVRADRADRTRRAPVAGPTDLADLLGSAVGLARRSLVVVVSDFIGTGDWERRLAQLAHRNEVVAIRVVDDADDALPQVGLVVVEDAETGEQLLVDTADPWFRARYSDGVSIRETELLAGARRAGVPLHRVDTSGDLVTTLVDVVAETRRRRS